MKVNINTNDFYGNSFDNLLKDVSKSGEFVTVGVHGDVDNDVLKYAIRNEFGEGNIPSRPFIRQSFDKNQRGLKDTGVMLIQKYLDGSITKEQALFFWGESLVDEIQNEINEGVNFVENSAATIKKKGTGKHPLQDTGRLQQSIKAVVQGG